ncbi:MAG: alkaline phosphatase PhoX [Ilumatobacteraceae bacterium]
MTFTRRDILRHSALTGAAIAVGASFSGIPFGSVVEAAANRPRGRRTGYGPLAADRAGILDLPHGFHYRILAKGGDGYTTGFSTYDDGQKLAGDADGAASFPMGRSGIVLVTNHELSTDELAERVPLTFHGDPVPTYDPGAAGGTSNIVMDKHGRVVSTYPSLAGTFNNCGGGPTPWGTWLTCEENQSFVTKQHGYVFEVDPAGLLTTAQPYIAMGRFNHEAVGIDPATGIAYMTEDNGNGLFYRFVPTDTSQRHGSLGHGGALSAMHAEGLSRLGEVTTVGTSVRVSWTPIANPDQANLNATLANDTVTRSTKLEGVWYGNGVVYFCSSYETVPGLEHVGQIWALDPKSDTITLVAYIPVGEPTFDSPDNITVAPNGQMILCEDGDGEQYLIGLDPRSGELWAFARNAMGENEFAGANFSPDGSTLFVSIQNPSTTFAITGPWMSAGRSRHDRGD